MLARMKTQPASAALRLSAAALRIAALASLATMTTALFSQAPPINFQSTTINPDHTITFRYKDPAATKINLVIRDLTKPIPMTKGADGVWTATTQPLAPAIYNYYFDADGQWRYDPANPHVAIKFQNVTNLLTVPGDTPQPYDATDVPHGEVHHHFYTSKIVLHLPNNQSEYYVYTPPGYDPKARTMYPVLYLLHGFNEGAYSWTQVGRANYILDNLIAQGKAKPMIVVMPLGYGDLDYVTHARNQATSAEHTKRFPQALLTEILPQVEAQYHVLRDRDHRAIAGLSMGGQESLTIGLTNTDKFAYVIGLSSAAQGIPNNPALASLNPKSANLKLLWVSCGTEDSLSEPNHKLADWLKSKGMDVNYVQTPGVHSWIVWQDNLAHFAPLLFQGK
jgi:enterochelin esterase-like enzyme